MCRVELELHYVLYRFIVTKMCKSGGYVATVFVPPHGDERTHQKGKEGGNW